MTISIIHLIPCLHTLFRYLCPTCIICVASPSEPSISRCVTFRRRALSGHVIEFLSPYSPVFDYKHRSMSAHANWPNAIPERRSSRIPIKRERPDAAKEDALLSSPRRPQKVRRISTDVVFSSRSSSTPSQSGDDRSVTVSEVKIETKIKIKKVCYTSSQFDVS